MTIKCNRWTIFLLIVVVIVMASCKKETENKEEPVVSSSESPCPPALNIDSLRYAIREQVREDERRGVFMSEGAVNNPHVYGGVYKTNYTFSEKTIIYASPDTTSTVISVLPFCSIVEPLEGIRRQEIQGNLWMKIRYPSGSKSNGYIIDRHLADYAERNYNSGYGFLVGESDTMVDGYRNKIIEIRRYRENEHKILEKFKTKYFAHGYRFYNVHNSTLQGADENRTLFVYDTFRESCPGGGMKEFIMDIGGRLVTVTTVSTQGEGGYYDLETAYLPLKFGKGKVLLVADADVNEIFNWENADLNVFPYSASYNTPIEDLVVVKYESNGYSDADFEVDPQTVKVNTKVVIYKWDGKKLIKIKEQ